MGVLLKPLSVFFDDDQQTDLRNGIIFGFASSTPSQIAEQFEKINRSSVAKSRIEADAVENLIHRRPAKWIAGCALMVTALSAG